MKYFIVGYGNGVATHVVATHLSIRVAVLQEAKLNENAAEGVHYVIVNEEITS